MVSGGDFAARRGDGLPISSSATAERSVEKGVFSSKAVLVSRCLAKRLSREEARGGARVDVEG